MAVLIPVIAFYLWNVRLFGGDPKGPRRTSILLIVALVLDVLYMPRRTETASQCRALVTPTPFCEINGV